MITKLKLSVTAMIVVILIGCCSQWETVFYPITSSVTPAPSNIMFPTITKSPQSPTITPPAAGTMFSDSGQRLGESRSWDAALGDLDNDGDLDAFVANDGLDGNANAIWFNDGRGNFSVSDQSLGNALTATLGDVDNDGDLDVLTSFEQSTKMWLNNGGAQAGVPGIFTLSEQSLDCQADCILSVLGDFDSDGDVDVFLGTREANMVWLNDGEGVFEDSGLRLGDIFTTAASVGDLDSDGDLDILSGGWQGKVETWVNDGEGSFTYLEQNQLTRSGHIHAISLGDLDRDGDLDAIATVAGGDPSQVWFNGGDGIFITQQQIPATLVHDVALGDLDGDGDLDAMIAVGDAGKETDGPKVWLNDGLGTFSSANIDMGNTFCSSVALGDVDGDGDLDAFVTHTHWLENRSGRPNRVWFNQMP